MSSNVKTYAAAEGAGDGSAWKTAVDINFAAEPNQTIAPNGNYTIGGVTWTKINSANELAATAVVNGTGLRFTPASATNNWNGDRSLPAIQCSLSSIIPDFTFTTRMRFWMYVASGNWLAQYDATAMQIEYPTAITHIAWQHEYNTGAVRGTLQSTWNASSVIHLCNASADNVHTIDIATGVRGWIGVAMSGNWAGGWPSIQSLTPRAMRCDYNTSDTASQYAAWGTPAQWVLLLGAHRAGSATAFSTVIGAVRVDYATMGF